MARWPTSLPGACCCWCCFCCAGRGACGEVAHVPPRCLLLLLLLLLLAGRGACGEVAHVPPRCLLLVVLLLLPGEGCVRRGGPRPSPALAAGGAAFAARGGVRAARWPTSLPGACCCCCCCFCCPGRGACGEVAHVPPRCLLLYVCINTFTV